MSSVGNFVLASPQMGRHLALMKPKEPPPAQRKIMGIVNVTPDSFSDGGQHFDAATAIAHGLKLVGDGADFLDVGGESTRPGADPVSAEEELRRVVPVIEALAEKSAAVISIDTRKPLVACAAMAAGASIWNDVTALCYAPDSLEIAARLGCGVVLMHAKGDSKTMQHDPYYDDVVEEVIAFLDGRIDACVKAGISKDKLIIDPGIGFGKTVEHNLALLAHLERFTALGLPVLLGASRKRFIAALDGAASGPGAAADQRLGGSLAAVIEGRRCGASIFRVHDVAETRQAINIADAIEMA